MSGALLPRECPEGAMTGLIARCSAPHLSDLSSASPPLPEAKFAAERAGPRSLPRGGCPKGRMRGLMCREYRADLHHRDRLSARLCRHLLRSEKEASVRGGRRKSPSCRGAGTTFTISAPCARCMPGFAVARGERAAWPLSWFRTGGPAQVLFTPADEADLAAFLAGLPAMPVSVVGLGSNLLVRDGGVAGRRDPARPRLPDIADRGRRPRACRRRRARREGGAGRRPRPASPGSPSCAAFPARSAARCA